MPESMFGLPTHILLLHLVVVLLPIAGHADIGSQLVIWAAAFDLCLFAVVAIDLVRRAATPADALAPAEARAIGYLPRRWREATPSWAVTIFRVVQVLAVWSHVPDLAPSAG